MTEPLMDGKICLVTGGTAGIGLVTAGGLAERGARVIVVGRDRRRGEAAVAALAEGCPGAAVEFVAADLSDQGEIRRLAGDVHTRVPRLDVLVNNAGAMFGRRRTSADGIEMTFALNHLGYFLLTHELMAALRAAPAARVVNVASRAHRGVALHFDDLQHERRYSGWIAYKRSKLANLLFTYELARRLEGTGVTANALHPGFVATEIGVANGLLAGIVWRTVALAAITPEKGARTSIHLASAPDVETVSGGYFAECRPERSSAASCDREAAARLWDISAELTGIGSIASRFSGG
jgi:NAD(P)-dependent dehydrogenase (short-subunit alcohol dehydrogenase family)